jgi:hypothetical protein
MLEDYFVDYALPKVKYSVNIKIVRILWDTSHMSRTRPCYWSRQRSICNEPLLRTIIMPRLAFFRQYYFNNSLHWIWGGRNVKNSYQNLRICMLNVDDMLQQTNNHELSTAPFDSTIITGLGSMLEDYLVQYSTPKGQISCRLKSEFWRQFWPTTTKPPPSMAHLWVDLLLQTNCAGVPHISLGLALSW